MRKPTPGTILERLRNEVPVGRTERRILCRCRQRTGGPVRHVSRATMTLIALGEDVDDGDRDHVQVCAPCSSAMGGVRMRLLRIDRAGVPRLDGAPPPSVWAGIRRRLDLDEKLAGSLGSVSPVSPAVRPSWAPPFPARG